MKDTQRAFWLGLLLAALAFAEVWFLTRPAPITPALLVKGPTNINLAVGEKKLILEGSANRPEDHQIQVLVDGQPSPTTVKVGYLGQWGVMVGVPSPSVVEVRLLDPKGQVVPGATQTLKVSVGGAAPLNWFQRAIQRAHHWAINHPGTFALAAIWIVFGFFGLLAQETEEMSLKRILFVECLLKAGIGGAGFFLVAVGYRLYRDRRASGAAAGAFFRFIFITCLWGFVKGVALALWWILKEAWRPLAAISRSIANNFRGEANARRTTTPAAPLSAKEQCERATSPLVRIQRPTDNQPAGQLRLNGWATNQVELVEIKVMDLGGKKLSQFGTHLEGDGFWKVSQRLSPGTYVVQAIGFWEKDAGGKFKPSSVTDEATVTIPSPPPAPTPPHLAETEVLQAPTEPAEPAQ